MSEMKTRDVSPEMIEALNSVFKPILEFVSIPENQLALCFRGSNPKNETVKIYKNNHLIWELSLSNNSPKIRISANHARFMKDWKTEAIKKLMELGFKGSDGKSYEELEQKNAFIKSPDNSRYYMHNLVFFPTEAHPINRKFVEESFKLLDKMQESFFREKPKNSSEKQIDYFKKYYHQYNHKNNPNISYYTKFQYCLEKHVQQELFLKNHFCKSGLFIYDLEFAQPGDKDGNKPDMLGIRYDDEGNPFSICLIEVKSTPGALSQKSGLAEHLARMEDYIKSPYMDDRKVEAYRILNQYKDIGLYGVNNICDMEIFKQLKKEIIFIFTNELNMESTIPGRIMVDKELKAGVKVRDILVPKGYEVYENIHWGDISEKIVAVRKEYP